jgi:hypothetical protein
MRILLILLISIGFCQKTFAQTMNCDSLKREFDVQIAQAKKEGLDKAIIQQLEDTKKQILQLFCSQNNGTNNPITKPEKAAKNEQNQLVGNNGGKIMTTQFQSAFKITIYVLAQENSSTTKEQISYYINKSGTAILLDKSSLAKNSEFMGSLQEEGSEFDGWLMESNGNNTMFATSAEEGKIAMKIPGTTMVDWIPNKTKRPTVKALGTSKTIAGYACKAYEISVMENGTKQSFTCWASTKPLPIAHAQFPFFTMLLAENLGLPLPAKTGILQIEGKAEGSQYLLEVQAITPFVKTWPFTQYKLLSVPGK